MVQSLAHIPEIFSLCGVSVWSEQPFCEVSTPHREFFHISPGSDFIENKPKEEELNSPVNKEQAMCIPTTWNCMVRAKINRLVKSVKL